MHLLEDRKATVEQLMARAVLDNRPRKMAQWVEEVFAPPTRPYVPYRRAALARLVNGSIGFYELRAAASLWDISGITDPVSFVKAIECETTGTAKNDVVLSALSLLGTVDIEEEEPWTLTSPSS